MDILERIEKGLLLLHLHEFVGEEMPGLVYKEKQQDYDELISLAKLGKHIQWVSVADRMPADGQEVDIYTIYKFKEVDQTYNDEDKYFGSYEVKDVSHWREIPPNPEKEEITNNFSYKSLVYGFLNLSNIKQCEIISKLSLVREEDNGLRHVQIIDKFIKRAEDQKCIDEFWKEVQGRA